MTMAVSFRIHSLRDDETRGGMGLVTWVDWKKDEKTTVSQTATHEQSCYQLRLGRCVENPIHGGKASCWPDGSPDEEMEMGVGASRGWDGWQRGVGEQQGPRRKNGTTV
ncbi:hypothetical protein C8034_v006096 [Colletotrichum sidae]|uniref:Uncharacterized protein n=1 Tax=Colletotrichum sidae TaxID=1347389 RepID=A0A4V3I4A2_9PEZI|nr:hypothetical protein C8034_v006096 [Colletotrichum sidae]